MNSTVSVVYILAHLSRTIQNLNGLDRSVLYICPGRWFLYGSCPDAAELYRSSLLREAPSEEILKETADQFRFSVNAAIHEPVTGWAILVQQN
jgi:hypothetical protein